MPVPNLDLSNPNLTVQQLSKTLNFQQCWQTAVWKPLVVITSAEEAMNSDISF